MGLRGVLSKRPGELFLVLSAHLVFKLWKINSYTFLSPFLIPESSSCSTISLSSLTNDGNEGWEMSSRKEEDSDNDLLVAIEERKSLNKIKK